MDWIRKLVAGGKSEGFKKPPGPRTRLELGEKVHLPKESRVGNLLTTIGRGTVIRGPLTVRGKGTLIIGNYCALGEGIRVVTSNHHTGGANVQIRLQRRLGFNDISGEPRQVSIGNACWVGDCAIFLPGSAVGDGTIVGAGAVVTKSFPPFSVVGGNPARVLKMRFTDEVRDALLQLAWWEWPEDRMARNKPFFNLDLSRATGVQQIWSLIRD